MRNLTLILLTLTLFSFAQVSLEKAPFPLSATIMKLKKTPGGAMEMYIAFYNESSRLIKGFTGDVQFIFEGEKVWSVLLHIEKNMPSEENTTWWGTVGYDAYDAKQVALMKLDIDKMDMHIVVKSIVNAKSYEIVY